MLKSKLLIAVVTLILCGSIYSQSEPVKPVATKYRELGQTSQAKMRETMEALRKYLGAREELQLFIINYGTRTALKQRRKLITNSIYWRDGPLDSTRITFVDGPVERKIRTVFWIVPPGADNPQPEHRANKYGRTRHRSA